MAGIADLLPKLLMMFPSVRAATQAYGAYQDAQEERSNKSMLQRVLQEQIDGRAGLDDRTGISWNQDRSGNPAGGGMPGGQPMGLPQMPGAGGGIGSVDPRSLLRGVDSLGVPGGIADGVPKLAPLPGGGRGPQLPASVLSALARVNPQEAAKVLFPGPKPDFDLAPGARRFRDGPEGPVEIAAAPFAPKERPLPEGLGEDGMPIPGYLDLLGKKTAITREPKAGTTETWNNPVSEIGPEGKPISVQYSNLGTRRVVAGATPSRQGNPNDRDDYWRSQVKPFADSATNARVQAQKVKTSLALGTGTGHIAGINALQKMIDEGAVVRDQDVALIQSAQSLMGKLGAQMEQLQSGKLLSPELQQELQGVADTLEQAVYNGVNDRVSAYEPVMKKEGVALDSVLPPKMREMFAPKAASVQTWGRDANGRPVKIK